MNTNAHSQALANFNAEEYREALLAFEQQWHTERSDVLRAMIQLCNALNQLRLGLASGPRHNLASAARLLAPLPDTYAGLDIAAIRDYIATLRVLLSDHASPVAWEHVPRLFLPLHIDARAIIEQHTEVHGAPMPNDINQTVDQFLSGGLEHASEAEILERLDFELQQQAVEQSAVLGTGAAQPWAGGDETGGSRARRFLALYTDAIHKEICDPEKGRLKDEYRGTVDGRVLTDQVKALVPYVLTALGIGASFVNPVAIATLVALWLVRVGLDQWCAAPRASMAEAVANTGASPAPIDPSLAASAAGRNEGRAQNPSAMASNNQLLEDLLEQSTGTGNAPAPSPASAPSQAPASSGSAPMPVDPAGSTGVANTESAHPTNPEVPIDPATTSSNSNVRGES